MTARDFCYWLQGFFEVHGIDKERIILRPEQVEVIKRHLSMVFEHDIDPKAEPCRTLGGNPVVYPNDLEMDYVRHGAHAARHADPADHVMLCPLHHGTARMAGYQWATAHRAEMRAWLDNGRRRP